jgi:hypothetical protein
MQWGRFQHGTLDLFPQNMKPAMLAQVTHVISSSITLKIAYFQRETPMKPSSATAISRPNIAFIK